MAEFRTLNRCLDNAIADAVKEFSHLRDAFLVRHGNADANGRLLILCHDMKGTLGNATLAARALELGNLSITGATGATLKHSHAAMGVLIDSALAEATDVGGAG